MERFRCHNRRADVTTIGIGIDGTCLLMCEDGWRESMVGTISLYDQAGERLHTTYIGATPEYGKKTNFYAHGNRDCVVECGFSHST